MSKHGGMKMHMIFISMFIIQYVFMSFIMTNKIENITNSVGKLYISTIMGLFMLVIMDYRHIYGALLLLFIFLYKTQFGISDKEYLREMIEHHSMALLTSEQILKKSTNNDVIDISQRIIKTQEKEIQEMQNIIYGFKSHSSIKQ
jgi:hypothetical protein